MHSHTHTRTTSTAGVYACALVFGALFYLFVSVPSFSTLWVNGNCCSTSGMLFFFVLFLSLFAFPPVLLFCVISFFSSPFYITRVSVPGPWLLPVAFAALNILLFSPLARIPRVESWSSALERRKTDANGRERERRSLGGSTTVESKKKIASLRCLFCTPTMLCCVGSVVFVFSLYAKNIIGSYKTVLN